MTQLRQIYLGQVKASNPETRQRCKAMFKSGFLITVKHGNELFAALGNVQLTFLADNIKKRLSTNTGK